MLPPNIKENLNHFFDADNDEDVILGIQLAKSLGIDVQKYLDYSIYSTEENTLFLFPEEPFDPETDLIKAIRKVRKIKRIELSLEDFLLIDLNYFTENLIICIDSFESFHKTKANCQKLSSTTGIQEVKLRKCNLDKIPEFIFEIKHLKKLDVSHNFIKEIPPTIKHLTFLKEIALQFNSLDQLPKTLIELTNLETLWIACNKFTHLPSILKLMTNLKELYFFDMPIEIDEIKQFKLEMSNCKFYFR